MNIYQKKINKLTKKWLKEDNELYFWLNLDETNFYKERKHVKRIMKGGL